jgi:hypothetical protein
MVAVTSGNVSIRAEISLVRYVAFIIGATLALTAAASVYDVAGPSGGSVDVTRLDIGGVKLAMRKDEAVIAISTSLKIAKDNVVLTKCAREAGFFGKKEPTGPCLVVSHGVGKFTIFLDTCTPEASEMIVTGVKYEMPSTPDNIASIEKAVIEKYGYPTHFSPGIHNIYDWCLKPSVANGNQCFFTDGPVLEFHETSLKMIDIQCEKAWDKFMEKKNTGKPVF